MFNFLSIVPTWAYWAAIGVLTAAVGAQQVRVSHAKTELAQEVSSRATERAERTNMALVNRIKIEKIESQHAAEQQKKDEEYTHEIAKLKSDSVRYVADAQRLRNKLTTFTSSDLRPGETDAAAGRRARDRLPLIGDLLAEGVELEAESRAIIQRRDAEVGRLADQIRIDRLACSGT